MAHKGEIFVRRRKTAQTGKKITAIRSLWQIGFLAHHARKGAQIPLLIALGNT